MPNTAPMNWAIIAQEQIMTAVSLPFNVDLGSFCWCRYSCEPSQYVFAGDVALQSDLSSFLFKRITSLGTISQELYKAGKKVADLDNDTYGTYYGFGDLPYIDLKGYLLDWRKVYDAFGPGLYQVKAQINYIFGTYTYESPKYHLTFYNQIGADKTIRFEAWQDGYIESNDIDYSGLNWYTQVRLSGTMRNVQPVYTDRKYYDEVRVNKQIQASINDEYELELYDLDENTKDLIVKNYILANRIKITDYTLVNNNRYIGAELSTKSIEDLTYKSLPGCNLILKFSPAKENDIKRNAYFR